MLCALRVGLSSSLTPLPHLTIRLWDKEDLAGIDLGLPPHRGQLLWRRDRPKRSSAGRPLMSSRCRSDCRIGATSGHVKFMPRSVHRHPDACTVGHSALLRCPGCPVRRPVSQVAKKRRRALCAALQEHQAKQIQARADLIALGIAPERVPWRRIRREAQEEAAEEQGFARRQAAALESARLAREPKPTDDTDE